MRICAVLAGVVLAAVVAFSGRAQSPWYVSASAGAYWREEDGGPTIFTRANGTISAPGLITRSFDLGPTVSLAVGYKLPLRLRLEGEASYVHYTPDQAYPTGSGGFPALNGSAFDLRSGDFNRYLATLNLFYDLPVEGRFVPYVGGGAGYAHADQSQQTFVSSAGSILIERSQAPTDHGVILAEAGVTIALNDAWALVPAYRYMHYFENPNAFGDENAHIFKLGVRYSFQ